jgi:AraC family transcriptional activator of tynA and feaB
MQKLFSTDDVHPRDRFDYWHAIACQRIARHDSRPSCRQGFHASMQGNALINSSLLQFENSAMDVRRTRQQVDGAASADVFFCLQLRGSLVIEQSDRIAILETGDMALIDPALPYAGRFSSESKLLVFKTPRAALEARVGKVRDVVIRVIKPSSAESQLLGSYLTRLPTHIDQVSLEVAKLVEDHLLDLIAVSLPHEATPKISSARSLALLRLRATINSRLSDPALNPEAAAKAAGISVRYANALLSHEGLSIMRLILGRRLERCRTALDDPRQRHRTISEIAFAWGFSDMTHFGRRFKAAYGSLPSDYRQRGK